MSLASALSRARILPLIVTYQTEGPRIDYARHEAARIGIPANIVLSIRSGDPRGAAIYDPKLNARNRKNAMTPGEIACYWGHREAWQTLLKDGADYALVLEDDFYVKQPELLQSAIEALPDMPEFDILLFRIHKPRGKVRSWSFGDFALEDRLFGATGATAYLISAEGAGKLLNRSRIFRPVDEDFITPWELGLQILNLNPQPIGETETFTSSLDNQRVTRPADQKRPLFAAWLKAHWQILSLYHWLTRGKADRLAVNHRRHG